ncbi:hypothetical protein L0F63_004460 [Massospora cicadina]|nr:hypothetical protein L0F63_004460 [Massospora cicadina]
MENGDLPSGIDSDTGPNTEDNTTLKTGAHSDSSIEIRNLLIKAYDVIAEKEQELDQAFKVRRAIIDENAVLKSDFEKLKENLNHFPFSLSPTTLNHAFKYLFVPSESQPLKSSASAKTRNLRRNLASRHDEEAISELENQIASLQKKLEAALEEKNRAEKSGRKETRGLLNEIDNLKKELELSYKRIEELEETNELLMLQKRSTSHSNNALERRSSLEQPAIRANSVNYSNVLSSPWKKDADRKREAKLSEEKEHNEFSLRLLENISELDKINRSLAASKRDAEEQAKTLKLELENLQIYVAELERNLQQSEQNQYIIDQQAKQISELMGKLEQKQSGFFQQFIFSPRSSISSIATAFNGNNQRTPKHSVKMVYNDNRFHSAKGHHQTASASSAAAQNQPPRRTLLTELEGEFYRHFSGSAKQLEIADWVQTSQELSVVSSPIVEGGLSDHENQVEKDPFMTVELYSGENLLPNPLSKEESFPPQCDDKEYIPLVPRRPSNGPIGIVNTVRKCAFLVWKWCRFVALVFAAVGVAFYRGPDSDIGDYYYD